MSLVKKDLEIVYSLRWKNGPKREHKKQASIVAVYDIPATTLNFSDFKSYLLKNSGTAEQDVTVYYITDQGKEYPIQSQVDFQVVLYAFRRKARANEVINLLLERKEDPSVHKNSRISNDVETQFDSMEPPSVSGASSMCGHLETPPEWFIAALAQLKRDIKEEVTANISGIVASAVAEIKTPQTTLPVLPQLNLVYPHRSLKKPEKRLKKHGSHGAEHHDAKEIHKKSIRLENKLEKLELKASKYREKRFALQHGLKLSDHATKSSDSDTGHTSSGSRCKSKKEKPKKEERPQQISDEGLKMDAQPIDVQKSVPHMLGGEIYLHQWDVQNTGEVAWTNLTQLNYAWGSKHLVPMDKEIKVPFLKPREVGTISVRFQIPTQPGTYECYWQFTHNGRRFGHWLGVQVIVDPFDLKGHASVLTKSNPLDMTLPSGSRAMKRESSENPNSAEALASIYKSLQGDKEAEEASTSAVKAITEELVREVSNGVTELRLSPLSQSESADEMNKWPVGLKYHASSLNSSSLSLKSNVDENGEPFVVPRCFIVDDNTKKSDGIPLANCFGLEETKLERKESIPTSDQTDFVFVPIPSKVPEEDKQPEQQNAASTVQRSESNAVNFDSNNNNNNNAESGAASNNSFKLRDEELDNIVVITVPKDEQIKEGFIYVHVDGQKVLIPKNILKSEVVSAAQELERSPDAPNSVGVIIESNDGPNKSPSPVSSASTSSLKPKPKTDEEHLGNTLDSVPPKNLAEPIIPLPANLPDNKPVDLSTNMPKEMADFLHEDGADRSNYFEANNFMSHCSAAGSCFSEVNSQAEKQSRVFVFPRDVPGYEVVYPVLNIDDPQDPNLTTETYEAQPLTAPQLEGVSYTPPNPFMESVPNYQQTPPELRRPPVVEDPVTEPLNPTQESTRASYGTSGTQPERQRTEETTEPAEDHVLLPQVHILPEMLVSGAVNAASTAFSTARSVFNNIIHPQAPGTWINGHWVSNNPTTPREANLQALAEMGFWNRDLNATLLARFNDDLNRVVAELVQ
ncbi:uncharacterized protein LOC126739199 isoform X2 [Anthonomus grandis grandis]|uniref:uncharacterized protein LOC126739199 isoform X2 n=1 Tax=Anthonomus grandis grandis TaxID=2921223 RepID=UPI002166551B|nr:uncharacterized protein LOC126739199 isoform X2 [Anthonomus grandis grandis]